MTRGIPAKLDRAPYQLRFSACCSFAPEFCDPAPRRSRLREGIPIAPSAASRTRVRSQARLQPEIAQKWSMDRDTVLFRISVIWLVILAIGCAYFFLA